MELFTNCHVSWDTLYVYGCQNIFFWKWNIRLSKYPREYFNTSFTRHFFSQKNPLYLFRKPWTVQRSFNNMWWTLLTLNNSRKIHFITLNGKKKTNSRNVEKEYLNVVLICARLVLFSRRQYFFSRNTYLSE